MRPHDWRRVREWCIKVVYERCGVAGDVDAGDMCGVLSEARASRNNARNATQKCPTRRALLWAHRRRRLRLRQGEHRARPRNPTYNPINRLFPRSPHSIHLSSQMGYIKVLKTTAYMKRFQVNLPPNARHSPWLAAPLHRVVRATGRRGSRGNAARNKCRPRVAPDAHQYPPLGSLAHRHPPL
jgi:hypothetical protein